MEEESTPELGERLPVPEVSPHWDAVERWEEVARWTWKRTRHINVLEANVAATAAARAAQRRGIKGKRVLIMTDSQATLGTMAKGRSSALGMKREARKVAAISLAYGIKFYWRYIRTHRNPADGPSRGKPLKTIKSQHVKPTHEFLPEAFRKTDG